MNETFQDQSDKLYEYNFPKPPLEDVVIHFGILGMHWGQRNGPPYPLGSGDHSASEKKAGWRKSLSGGGNARATKRRSKALKKARKTRAKNIKMRTLEKKKQAQIQKSKEEIIKSKDIKSMLNNVDMFTNQEINDLLNRLDVENKLKSRVNAMNEASKPLVIKLLKSIKNESVAGAVSAGKQLVRKGGSEGFKIISKKLLSEMIDPQSQAPDGRTWKEIIDGVYGQPGKKGGKKKKG